MRHGSAAENSGAISLSVTCVGYEKKEEVISDLSATLLYNILLRLHAESRASEMVIYYLNLCFWTSIKTYFKNRFEGFIDESIHIYK